jgi:hypothetical protein
MRSLTEKKFVNKKPKVALKPSRSLYIPGARQLNRMEVMEQFAAELHAMGHAAEQVHVGTPELEETFRTQLEDTFRTQVFLDFAEVLYKVRCTASDRLSLSYSLSLAPSLSLCTMP